MKEMKKIFAHISVISAVLLVSACSLEEYNPHSHSADEDWTTAAGYKKKINDCYFDYIRLIYGQAEDYTVGVTEAGTDIWADPFNGSKGDWSIMHSYNGLSANNSLLRESYKGFYSTVSACNGAIAYADKVEGLSQAEIDALVAEAYFLRANSLFNIVEYYGGKYLPTEPLTERLKELPMSTVNKFYDVILSDLEFAMSNLPLTQSVYGHVTRAAAYHVYAKACLTYASYTDGLGNCDAVSDAERQELLGKAKKAADELLDNQSKYGVSLYGSAAEIFSAKNNKDNKEALFVVTHSSNKSYNPRGSYYNRWWRAMVSYDNSTDGYMIGCLSPSFASTSNGKSVPLVAKGDAKCIPTKYMFDLYQDNDERYAAFFRDVYYANNFTDGQTEYLWNAGDANRFKLDPARADNKDFAIGIADTCIYFTKHPYTQAQRDATRYAVWNIDDNYTDPTHPGKFAPGLKKGDIPEFYDTSSSASNAWTWADCIVYRLAETYLLSAEIEHRLGNDAAAAARLNVIRNRACAGHDGSLDITAAQVDDDFLLDEYARELCGEWNRWGTLKRFRALQRRIAACNPQISKFDPNIHYFRPIFIDEINAIENGKEYQNPGY